MERTRSLSRSTPHTSRDLIHVSAGIHAPMFGLSRHRPGTVPSSRRPDRHHIERLISGTSAPGIDVTGETVADILGLNRCASTPVGSTGIPSASHGMKLGT